jgi:hypothetical protein
LHGGAITSYSNPTLQQISARLSTVPLDGIGNIIQSSSFFQALFAKSLDDGQAAFMTRRGTFAGRIKDAQDSCRIG